MTLVRVGILFLIGVVTLSFASPSSPWSDSVPQDWKCGSEMKVRGYRFRSNGELTLLNEQGVNLKALGQVKAAQAELNPADVVTLLNSVFSTGDPQPIYACYNPHHIFVFYDKEGKATRAIEVCFECRAIDARPGIPENRQRIHDLAGLAKLCKKLGLWDPDLSLDQYLERLKEL